MDTLTEKIRKIAQELLSSQAVEKVIGFEQGSIPMTSRPVIIQSETDAEKLVFNSVCSLNLANYVRGHKGKIGVVAKGCDTRNIVTHIVENQVTRDNIVIIGVPCKGMVDRVKISEKFDAEITGFSEKDDLLTIKTQTGEHSLSKNDYLKDNCRRCMHRNPVIYDHLAAELVEEQTLDDPFDDVRRIEELPMAEKSALFNDLTKNCIRCYACRNACPLCYCPTCFVDESKPQWVGKGQNKTDIDTFHFLRAFHCAGRCTDCGACVEACPMNIDVRLFTRKLNKDAFEMFGWEAGLDPERRPALDVFNPDDPDEFIK